MYFIKFISGNNAYRIKINELAIFDSELNKHVETINVFCKGWTNATRDKIEYKSKLLFDILAKDYTLSKEHRVSRAMSYWWIKHKAFETLEEAKAFAQSLATEILEKADAKIAYELEQEILD